jgi:L-lysine exporter family protein LysE/ArgO
MLTAALTGFFTCLTLIMAIGAQNAFVLRQGLMRAHVLAVCLVCAGSDAILVSAGVAGIGTLSAVAPWAPVALTLAGAAFLIVYGALSLYRAFFNGALSAANHGTGSLGEAIMTCLAITWLNPHVYLDTVILMGAVSAGFGSFAQKGAYVAGAVFASFVFFLSLGYGARLLAPFFASHRAWRSLDVGIALVMWSIAAGLIAGVWGG